MPGVFRSSNLFFYYPHLKLKYLIFLLLLLVINILFNCDQRFVLHATSFEFDTRNIIMVSSVSARLERHEALVNPWPKDNLYK